ncbi:MAG: hypothetical protein AB8E87_13475 [Prochlorococcus sp.]
MPADQKIRINFGHRTKGAYIPTFSGICPEPSSNCVQMKGPRTLHLNRNRIEHVHPVAVQSFVLTRIKNTLVKKQLGQEPGTTSDFPGRQFGQDHQAAA